MRVAAVPFYSVLVEEDFIDGYPGDQGARLKIVPIGTAYDDHSL